MSGTLTSVPGIAVGHAQDFDALTGCTVVLLPQGTVAAVDVRGGAPGSRETELLAPAAMAPSIHALCLSGGSAFGLAAATGVMDWLHERGVGFDVRVARVPLVPAAVIFDLALGRSDRWPDAGMGYAACAAASSEPVLEGCVGAGTGATVGKILGPQQATKSGLGSAAITLPGGVTVAALAVTNAFGDVRPGVGAILAGARKPDGGWLDTAQHMRTAQAQIAFGGSNTTLGIVATDAVLSKAECQKLAQMAQNALPRTIWPVHTPFDGDIVFGLATGSRPSPHLAILGTIAADILAEAIERSVLSATSIGGLPAAREFAAL